jgi:hypothetical protein
MQMTTKQKEKLEKARDEAVKNPPKELLGWMIDTSKSKNPKNTHDILMEMRYGKCK